MPDIDHTFNDGTSLSKLFSGITKEKIICICISTMPDYKTSLNRSKDKLFSFMKNATVEQQIKIREMVNTTRNTRDGLSYTKRKQEGDGENDASAKRLKTQHQRQQGGGLEVPINTFGQVDGLAWEEKLEKMKDDSYMKGPTLEERNQIIANFIKATGNDALRMDVCAVCGRTQPSSVVTLLQISHIPRPDLLKPASVHPAYDIYQGGMLLDPAGVKSSDKEANICRQCNNSLLKGKTPSLALANGMWIGSVPLELRILTLPEQILISKYLTVAYIVKLFPKHGNSFAWDRTQMHSGLKGHVSTYQLDPALVAPYVSARVLPPHVRVLSSTLGVTFVTPAGVPERMLEPLFVVRKQRVKDALLWLKANNPLYADIEISQDNLDTLPENGVPDVVVSTVRHSSEVEALAREHGSSYVPPDALDEVDIQESQSPDTDEGMTAVSMCLDSALKTVLVPEQPGATGEKETGPHIIPLFINGVVDAEGRTITDTQLMAHALANCAANDTDLITYSRGNQHVSEYPRLNPETKQPTSGTPDDPNHLLGSFPTLFPYGQGGLETERVLKVTYEAHVRWCLEYHDKRFRKHLHFIFQVFGVTQKRQFCKATVLQIDKTMYAAHKDIISTVNADDLMKASEEEAKKQPFSHDGVRLLCKHVKAIRAKVPGTDEQRLSCKSYFWGTTLAEGNPTIWFTLNPPDSQDPIAQVIAGEDIDLDNFQNTIGPDHADRARNIAADPYAAAQFFHLIANTAFAELVGLSGSAGHPHRRKMGVFGMVKAYVGMVEAQQRGTLHVHVLIWLEETPKQEDIRKALLDAGYRAKIQTFIGNTIKADIDGLDTDKVRQIPKEPGISYSRPIDPQHVTDAAVKERIRALARAVQFHTCDQSTCLVPSNGRLICKRGAPFKLCYTEWINARGEWGPKRTCGYLNNWNDIVLLCCRCNHDVKLIVNGAETCVLVLYTGNYAAKKQNRTTNTSALLARKVAFHRKYNTPVDDAINKNKLLLQRCANALFTQKEFSGPEVVSCLMGWGDHFLSHQYAPIFWDSAVAAICKSYPGIKNYGRTEDEASDRAILTIVDGSITLKSQLGDYQHRGHQLESFNLYDFCVDTYETHLTEKDKTNDFTTRGRPRYERIPYLIEADKPSSARIIRTPGHETLPRIIGQWLPKNNKPELAEFYGASILTLFQPWRNLTDLKSPNESFAERCTAFIEAASPKIKKLISNLQFYHKCWDKAAERRDALKSGHAYPIFDYEPEVLNQVLEDREEEDEPDQYTLVVTEELIEARSQSQRDPRETKFAQEAMSVAHKTGIFNIDEGVAPILPPVNRRADLDDIPVYVRWERYLKSITRNMHESSGVIDLSVSHSISDQSKAIPPCVIAGTPNTRKNAGRDDTDNFGNNIDADADESNRLSRRRDLLELLNTEQRLAHDILEERLVEELETGIRRPIKLLVHGPGGVGKSVLIAAMTETYAHHGQQHALAKCGSSGIAASNIEGSTIHSWAGLKVGKMKGDKWLDSPSDSINERRKRNIPGTNAILLDELSMTTTTVFANLSRVCTTVKLMAGECGPSDDFGGMHVVGFADFHQFPPVANETAALYCEPSSEDPVACLGRELFLQFNNVVMLHQQMRVRDQVWTDILQRLRVGACTTSDIEEIRRLVLTSPNCEVPDFSKDDWADAVLITTRHGVREEWNRAATRRNAKRQSQLIYVCPSEDTKKDNTALTLEDRYHIAGTPEKKAGRLAQSIELFRGMRVMVLLNLATEADIANGTRGVIEDLILDPRESATIKPDDKGFVRLEYPPRLVLFRPDKGCKYAFKGDSDKGIADLPEGLVPLSPTSAGFELDIGGGRPKVKYSRRQFSLTAGYAFTDYKSQGQTIEKVIIDLANPPTGKLSPFNAYVALSRSRGRDSIRLLRDFDERLFMTHPSESLAKDMARLEQLAAQTMQSRGYST